jgi:hypothetical protein
VVAAFLATGIAGVASLAATGTVLISMLGASSVPGGLTLKAYALLALFLIPVALVCRLLIGWAGRNRSAAVTAEVTCLPFFVVLEWLTLTPIVLYTLYPDIAAEVLVLEAPYFVALGGFAGAFAITQLVARSISRRVESARTEAALREISPILDEEGFVR